MPNGRIPAPAMTWENAREHFAAEITAEVEAKVAAKIEEERKAARAEGAAAERERILAIQNLAVEGSEAVIAECVADTSCTPGQAARRVIEWQQAQRILSARRSPLATRILAADLAPEAETPEPSTDAAVAARILETHREHKDTVGA